MPNKYTAAQDNYSSQVASAIKLVGNPQVNPNDVYFIIGEESSSQANAVSDKGAQGVMQILPSTFNAYKLGGTDPFDAQTSINTGVNYYSYLLNRYGGDTYKALAAYNAGPGRLDAYLAGQKDSAGNPIDLPNETKNYLNDYSNQSNTANSLTSGTPSQASTSNQASVPELQPNDAAATPATAKFGVPYPTETSANIAALNALQDAINPNLVISSGIDETPWYKDPNIARSKRPQPVAHPVTFKVYFDKKGPFCNSASKPIVICLNASLSTFSKSMQHIVSRQHTRTGVLIDFWGSNPDVVSGEGSTGLFLNQVGITSYFSLAKPTDKIKAAITAAFKKKQPAQPHAQQIVQNATSGNFKNSTAQAVALSQAVALTEPPLPGAPAYVPPTLTPPPALPPPLSTNGFFLESSLRVGARDAFAELLSLFKNNGVVYFRSDTNNTGLTSSEQQVGLNAWSPKFGRSTYQAANSRSDVMTRGRVEMSFRNTLYSGYFKSLSWTMAADKPYSWDFNFVFQVESSTTQVDVAPTKQQYGKLSAMTTPPPEVHMPTLVDPFSASEFAQPQVPSYLGSLPATGSTVGGTLPPYTAPASIYNPLTWK